MIYPTSNPITNQIAINIVNNTAVDTANIAELEADVAALETVNVAFNTRISNVEQTPHKLHKVPQVTLNERFDAMGVGRIFN